MAIKNIWMIVLLSAFVFIAHVTAEKNTNSDSNANSPRPDGCAGCPSELNPNDEAVNLYLDKAFKKYGSEYPGDNYPALHTFVSGTKQVVSGVKYVMNIKIGKSNCTKKVQSMDNCTVLADSPIHSCVVTAYIKAWENYEDINVTCDGL